MINMDCDFSKYKLIVAPMLYMVRPGVGERIEEFVKAGGTFVATYWSGIVDESDLCFLGGFPGPLRKVLGIWSEEIESLADWESNCIVFNNNNELGLKGEFKAVELCDLIHAESASVLAEYTNDFYAGRPSVTVNNFGEGKAYYVASRNSEEFNDVFFGKLIDTLNIHKTIEADLPYGVTAQQRTDGKNKYVFIMNFNDSDCNITLGNTKYDDLISEEQISGDITLKGYGIKVLKTN